MQRVRRPDTCFSELTFDRACAGELSAAAQRELEEHLSACVSCSLRYQVLSRQREEFLKKADDWAGFAAQQRPPARRHRLQAYSAAVGLAAAALLGIVVARPTDETHGARLKGGESIGFFVRRDAHVIRGASGDNVYPADELRFTYTSEKAQYFALLYADDHTASVYYPLAEETVRIEAGLDVPLDFGIALDEQLGTERAFGLFCDAAQPLEPLRAALQKTGTLPAPAGCHVDILVLQKRPK